MESNPTPKNVMDGKSNLSMKVNELLSGQPRQFEQLSPAFMD